MHLQTYCYTDRLQNMDQKYTQQGGQKTDRKGRISCIFLTFFVLAVTLGNLVLVARGDLVLVVRGDLVPERRGVLFVEELGDFLVLALILLSPLCRMLLPCLPLGVLRTLKDMDWRRSALRERVVTI